MAKDTFHMEGKETQIVDGNLNDIHETYHLEGFINESLMGIDE
jgi:hypothetical protein